MNDEPTAPPPGKPLPATTTAQQDLTTQGQRRINLIWERTQAFIAVFVTVSAVAMALWALYAGKEVSAFMAYIAGNVVGNYFSRTNHATIGGTGGKPSQDYIGR